MKKNILLFIFVLIIVSLFYYYPLLPIVFRETGEMFFIRVVPYLFVMMVMSELFIMLHLEKEKPIFISRVISFFFHTSHIGSLIYLFSLISGIPANIYFMKKNYEQGLISKKEIRHILSFSCYFNPLFLYAILINNFGYNVRAYILFLLPYIYGFIIGIIKRPREGFNDYSSFGVENLSFVQVIQGIMNTLMFVYASIMISRLLFIYLPNNPLLKGLFEVTQGFLELNKYDSLNIRYLVSSIFISFLGCSILMQTFGVFEVISRMFKRFMLSRINLFIIYLILLMVLLK